MVLKSACLRLLLWDVGLSVSKSLLYPLVYFYILVLMETVSRCYIEYKFTPGPRECLGLAISIGVLMVIMLRLIQ